MDTVSNCRKIQQMYIDLDDTCVIVFFCLLMVTGLLGIATNAFLVYLVMETKQFKNQSIRLLTYLSFVDILSSCISCVLCLQILYASSISCDFTNTISILNNLSKLSSGYFAALTGLDRYLRVTYLNDYERVFTPTKFRIAIFVYVITVLLLTLITTYFHFVNSKEDVIKIIGPINFLSYSIVIGLYILSIRKLKGHAKDNVRISEKTAGIAKITKLYFYLFILSQGYMILMHTLSLQGFISQHQKKYFVIINGNVPAMLGIINAIIVMNVNRKIKRRLVTNPCSEQT